MPSVRVPAPRPRPDDLGPFAFGEVAGRVILTNDAGDWTFLDRDDFTDLVEGRLDAAHPRRGELVAKGFVRAGADLEALAARIARKRAHVGAGPHLHVVVATLRCNQSCRYCHASRRPEDAGGVDLRLADARRVVDRALRTPSPHLAFEFQGGEPTLHPDVLRFVVGYARQKNRHEGKDLSFSVVTNLTAMTEDLAQWLVDEGLWICTSLDGPADLHDRNRPWRRGGSAHAEVERWLGWFGERYAAAGRDPRTWHVDALLTTTRDTLRRGPEVVDEYVRLGLPSIHLRPLNPFGFAAGAWRRIGYTTEEFLAFYEETLDHVLALNRRGVEIVEGTAAVVLTKLLTPDDGGYVDLRSPCGAGTGQVAYDHDGRVYPCDEARMVAAAGDPIFALGEVRRGSLAEDVGHRTVKALAAASLTEALPGCAGCWNRPFCGVCPVHSYQTCGDLFGQRPNSAWCLRQLGVSRILLERLADDPDGGTERIFRRWTERRSREEPGARS